MSGPVIDGRSQGVSRSDITQSAGSIDAVEVYGLSIRTACDLLLSAGLGLFYQRCVCGGISAQQKRIFGVGI